MKSISRTEWLALTGVLGLFVAVRLPLLFNGALQMGWNSESAVLGLMATAIARGQDFPLFFWGQAYLGPLTSYLAAALILVMDPIRALRIAVSLQMLAGICFYWAALRQSFHSGVANVTALWLAIGPAYVVFFSVSTLGVEQMFLIGAVIYWYATVTAMARPRDWLVLGLLAGFGWWIHQGTVFTTGPVIATAILSTQWWAAVPRAPWNRKPHPVAIGTGVLLLADTILGALRLSGFNVPAFYLFRPVAEPLVLLILLTIGTQRAALRALLRIPRNGIVCIALFALGAIAGYAPVIIGTLAGFVPGYGRSDGIVSLRGMLVHAVTFLRSDLWLFAGTIASIVVVPCFLVAVARRRRLDTELLTVLACVLFYLVMDRAKPGSVRYIVTALPMVYALAAETILRLRVRWVLVSFVAIALLVPAIALVRDVPAGRAEGFAGTPINPDPRPILRAIDEQGYAICYADYWIAYKLQWVSEERVRFIPWRSLDRNRAMSRELSAIPGPKCVVELDGRIRPLTAADLSGATSSRASERLNRLRSREQ